MNTFQFEKSINSEKLALEIYASAITIALDHIDTSDDDITIVFKDDLQEGEETILNAIVAAHDGLPLVATPAPREVVTQNEKNDKTLRTFCVFASTNEAGEAVFCVKVPEGGRYVAYGDIEFATRHFGDYVKEIGVYDYDRLIAMQAALQADPEAVEPLSDEVMQSTYPAYPLIGHYHERNTAAMNAGEHSAGTICSGMAMTLQFGVTEAQPIGGYGFLPGHMYFKVIAQKAAGQTTGHNCQLSIDWAEPDA